MVLSTNLKPHVWKHDGCSCSSRLHTSKENQQFETLHERKVIGSPLWAKNTLKGMVLGCNGSTCSEIDFPVKRCSKKQNEPLKLYCNASPKHVQHNFFRWSMIASVVAPRISRISKNYTLSEDPSLSNYVHTGPLKAIQRPSRREATKYYFDQSRLYQD